MSMLVPIKPAAAPKRLLVVSAIAAALALSIGGIPRLAAHGTVARQTDALAVPTVAVVTPARAPAEQMLVLPGDVEAFQEANIYARTSGYLHRWYSDIGTRVKRGDLLADIDAPELDAELAQARSDAATASANYDIARVTAARWQEMLKDDAVSRQSSEENVSTMKAKQAMLAAAQANVSRLAQLQSFEKVTAPFDGVITVRNVDTGALIDAGNGGTPAALFRLAETDRLRVFVDVPQDQAADVVAGAKANLALPQYPGRRFIGTVARTSGAIDAGSRTLRVEVDLDNPDGAVLPGAYAQVSLPLSAAQPGLSLPANALLFRPAGVQVAVVDARGAVQLRTVTLGRDFGARVEIRSGLQGDERVIVNPGDAVSAGQVVRINASPANA
ncbi:efflux RND transporter periplasmic adaptor subunit [Dyella sp. EPa41]|uniref:efflux RND transporter periplasmic adaptor subunit n=1 Tax=Dyella sp. EPa41 TaxID=1561194 RepID=UPI00191681A6|nr:efflux RND transporter periplasmic adaptor subunit [Dyella sp. EPa41]